MDTDSTQLPGTAGFNASQSPPHRKIFTKPSSSDSDLSQLTPLGIRRRLASFTDNADDADSSTKEVNFADIVDIDEDEEFEGYISEFLTGKLLEGLPFRIVIMSVIVMNSILIGIQTNSDIERGFASVLSSFDNIFLTIFVLEIGIKWYNGFLSFWKVGWNWFDFVIVISSLLGPALGADVSFSASGGRLLRIVRVIRAFRTLKSISALYGLQVIVQTVILSLPDMGNIVLLNLVINFIFSVIGVNILGSVYPERFGNMGSCMWTLYIILTQDGWMEIFSVLEKRGKFAVASVYFAAYITIGAFIFANIIVGITVTNLQTAYSELKRLRKAKKRALHHRQRKAEQSLRSIASINGVPPQVWKGQKPFELPEFSKISVAQAENYFLILAALERNMAEYQELKQVLEKTLEEIKEVNTTRRPADGEGGDDEFGGGMSARTETSMESSDDDELLDSSAAISARGGGDILSELIRRDRAEESAEKRTTARREKQTMQARRQQLEQLQEQKTRVERTQQWAKGGLTPRAGGAASSATAESPIHAAGGAGSVAGSVSAVRSKTQPPEVMRRIKEAALSAASALSSAIPATRPARSSTGQRSASMRDQTRGKEEEESVELQPMGADVEPQGSAARHRRYESREASGQ